MRPTVDMKDNNNTCNLIKYSQRSNLIGCQKKNKILKACRDGIWWIGIGAEMTSSKTQGVLVLYSEIVVISCDVTRQRRHNFESPKT